MLIAYFVLLKLLRVKEVDGMVSMVQGILRR
jgi:hypothetical protein